SHPVEFFGEPVQTLRYGRIYGQIVHERHEGLPVLRREFAVTQVGPALLLDLLDETFTRMRAARPRNDARACGNLPRTHAPIQRRHELAHGKIARAAEENQIERF